MANKGEYSDREIWIAGIYTDEQLAKTAIREGIRDWNKWDTDRELVRRNHHFNAGKVEPWSKEKYIEAMNVEPPPGSFEWGYIIEVSDMLNYRGDFGKKMDEASGKPKDD